MRPLHACFKLLQRQTYSCLSTRAGIWFCLGGLILLAISALQFGEVFLEWSMQKYERLTNNHDNIGRKSFQDRLCLPGPIDIVYTWVNGSDPKLIKELTEVKVKLISELNTTVGIQNILKTDVNKDAKTKVVKTAGNSEKFKWKDENVCPYPNCIPFNGIAVAGLPDNITKEKIAEENSHLPSFRISSFKNSADPSVKVIIFDENYDTEEISNHTISYKMEKKDFTKVFISSTIRLGSQKLDGIGIINYLPKSISKQDIKDGLSDAKIKEANVIIAKNISVIRFKYPVRAKQFLGPLRGQIRIRGGKFKILPATYLWRPLTPLEAGREVIQEDVSSSRFADNDELKYSLRSVDRYAPWIRKIFIVTNGQIPSWINLDHPRIKIVTHEELFVNKSHLPTYSSPAIETHIHRIKGLSKKFIYMNDDVFFGDNVWPDDFYTHAKGQKLYLTWPVPNCNEGCPAAWVNDKYCDKPCNVSECDWDGGDCLNTNGKSGWVLNAHSFTGSAYSAIGEYCNGGCANSWIGDRYCDANCNIFNCGFDAGDCGVEKLNELPSFEVIGLPEVVKVPQGVKAFILNFTNFVKNGVVTEGDFLEASVIRTATFSKKFKIMTVTLYANFTETVAFKIQGFKDMNQTMPFEIKFNVSIDTKKQPVATTTTTITTTLSTHGQKQKPVLKPYTVYNSRKKSTFETSHKKKLAASNETMNKVFDWFEKNKDILSNSSLLKLDDVEKEFKDGDITEQGYKKKKYGILLPIFESKTKFNQTDLMDASQSKDVKEKTPRRLRRHLLAVSTKDEALSHSKSNFNFPPEKSKQKLLAIRIIDDVSTVSDSPLAKKRKKNRKNSKRKRISQLSRWIDRYGHWDPITETQSTSPHRWERQKFFWDIVTARQRVGRQQEYVVNRKPSRMLLDTFASSLLHVSRIFNRAFGYKARKVPAHMPHMVDVHVINNMQTQFWRYFDVTSSHKIRRTDDMQFAFSYAYYLMDVPARMNMSLAFDELDTDGSGTLDDRELRTLAARMFSLPLQSSDIRNLEKMLLNCSKQIHNTSKHDPRWQESLAATKELIVSCKPIADSLRESLKKKNYNFEIVGDEDITFKMIRNNVSHFIYQLDWIRKNRRKFVCLNDNIDHDDHNAKLIRTILRDFLESLFPEQSQFELPRSYRNKFLKVDELRSWKEYVRKEHEFRWKLFYIIILVLVTVFFRRQIFIIYRKIVSVFGWRVTSIRGLNLDDETLVKI